jgi:hypothetical protein
MHVPFFYVRSVTLSRMFSARRISNLGYRELHFHVLGVTTTPKFPSMHNGRAPQHHQPHVGAFAEADLLMYTKKGSISRYTSSSLHDLFFLSFGKPACDLEFGGIRLSALINSFLCLPCFCMCGSASLIWILLQRIYIYTVSCAASVPDGKTNYLSSLIGIHRVHSFDRLSFIHPFRPVTPARSLG